jgi:hypothetical protein
LQTVLPLLSVWQLVSVLEPEVPLVRHSTSPPLFSLQTVRVLSRPVPDVQSSWPVEVLRQRERVLSPSAVRLVQL